MRIAVARFAVAFGALSVAACGGQSGSVPSSVAGGPASATQGSESRPASLRTAAGLSVPAQAQEAVIYSFAAGLDGEAPEAALTNVGGVLYGTTVVGGGASAGTVFKVTTSGAETVLYRFKGEPDGNGPESGLTNVGGVLYGTTSVGGDANNDGTVFQITPSGAERVLYRFQGGSDGRMPMAGLTNVNGVLYGTTAEGGDAHGDGTVFAITTSGVESVVYRFQGGDDGANPYVGLTDVAGVLYGATTRGGVNNGGTIFKTTTSGAEAVLYRFSEPADAEAKSSGLTDVDGVLYGAAGGGAQKKGIVFKITTSGAEQILHSFGGGDDGAGPEGLTNVGGVLYGTTYTGGVGKPGTGTVFKITTSGVKTTLYRFEGGNDAANPQAPLTDVNGVLYGTSGYGGAYNEGTVFSVSP